MEETMKTRFHLWTMLLTAFISCASPEVDNTLNNQDSSVTIVDSLPATEKQTRESREKTSRATNLFKGEASFYSDSFQGKKTSSGDLYDKNTFTAAIKKSVIPIAFGTIVEVHDVAKNKTVLVKVNDIMSESSSSIIDLSFAAAEQIGLLNAGRTDVVITIPTQDSALLAMFEKQGK